MHCFHDFGVILTAHISASRQDWHSWIWSQIAVLMLMNWLYQVCEIIYFTATNGYNFCVDAWRVVVSFICIFDFDHKLSLKFSLCMRCHGLRLKTTGSSCASEPLYSDVTYWRFSIRSVTDYYHKTRALGILSIGLGFHKNAICCAGGKLDVWMSDLSMVAVHNGHTLSRGPPTFLKLRAILLYRLMRRATSLKHTTEVNILIDLLLKYFSADIR